VMIHCSFLCVLLLSLCSTALCFDLWYQYDYCHAPLQLNETKTNLVLQLVQVITRHGDRTTLTILPNDNRPFHCNISTYVAPSFTNARQANPLRLYRKNYLSGVLPGNCNLGQLTDRGYTQHLSLGTNLRNLYVNTYQFLNPDLDQSEVALRSTDIPRTLQSAQANLMGLYPPGTPEGGVPVVDIFTMDTKTEYIYPNDDLCPRGRQLLQTIMESPEVKEYEKSKRPVLEQIANALGVKVDQLPGWSNMFDAFHVMQCYDIQYPTGITQDMADQVWEATNWEWNFQLQNKEMIKLWIGYFVGELVSNIQAKIALKSGFSPKYLMYSGHDTTLGPLLTAFGVYDGNWPPYASHIELELWSDSPQTNYFVQVKYQGRGLQMPGCDNIMCPIKQFLQLIVPVIPVDFQKECTLI